MVAALRKFIRWLLQVAAGVVIVLALLVGIARLLLPEVASFSEDLRAAVRDNTGFELEFELLSAGISLYGPELRMTKTEIRWPDRSELLRAEQIAISLDVVELFASRRLVPSRVLMRGSSASIEFAEDGKLLIQGHPLADYARSDEPFDPATLPNLRLRLEDLSFSFNDSYAERPALKGFVKELIAQLDDGRVEIQGEAEPGAVLGRKLKLRGELPINLFVADRNVAADAPWNLWVSAQDYRLDGWLELLRAQDLPIINSSGSAIVQFDFVGPKLVGLNSDLDLADIELPQTDAASAKIDSLEGQITWQATATGWQATSTALRLTRDGAQWPASDTSLRFSSEGEEQRLDLSANFLRVDDIAPFLRALGDERIEEFGLTGQPSGDIRDLSAGFTRNGDAFSTYRLSAEFEKAGYVSNEEGIDIRDFSGSVAADETGGSLDLETDDAVFGVEKLFREDLPIKRAYGLAIWRASEQGFRVLANRIELETEEGQGEASIELTTDADFGEPVIDLRATASLRDVTNADRYLPNKIPAKVLDWLDGAILGGSVPSASFRLAGPLKAFPYRNGEGEFLIEADFRDASLRYAPEWPEVTNASGKLVFSGPSMYCSENKASVAGISVENAKAMIADLKDGVILLEGQAQTELRDVLRFLRNSPVRTFTGPVIDDVRTSGPAAGKIKLRLPVRDMSNWQLDGYLDTRDADVTLQGLDFGFTKLKGRVTIDKTYITVEDATAELFDAPVTLSVTPLPEAEMANVHRATVSGLFDVPTVANVFSLPMRSYFSGTASATGSALLKPVDAATSEAFMLTVESDLIGTASALPFPLNKEASLSESLNMELQFRERGVIDLGGTLARGLNWQLQLQSTEQGWNVDRGVVNLGATRARLPEQPGLLVSGYVDTLRLEDWLDLEVTEPSIGQQLAAGATQTSQSVARWQDAFRLADLQINDLFALGFRFTDVDTGVRFTDNAWDINISGPWALGNIWVPYDFAGPTPMQMNMERLLLIEQEVTETGPGAEEPDIDPRELPAIRAEIDDFAIDKLRFGALSADIVKVPDGLQSTRLTTRADSFTTESSADWLVLESAQRSRLRMTLQSENIAATWQQLGQDPGISGESGTIKLNLLWEGGPSLGVIYQSTGELEFDIRSGRVSDLETGGGRLIGLFSLAYLPRRLALDFTDVTDEGLEFSSISGGFRLDFGNAWTCNMGLISEIADIGMVGRAGLLAEDYDQLAVVRPHVSSMLPLPAVLLGGPTVGVATLLISQLFKKSLSDIGETYYSIEGSWSDPQLTKKQRSQIDTESFADCEKGLPNLSPEEIAALEEFLSASEQQPSGPAPTGASPAETTAE